MYYSGYRVTTTVRGSGLNPFTVANIILRFAIVCPIYSVMTIMLRLYVDVVSQFQAHTHTYIHRHTYAHTYTHTHTYTHRHTCTRTNHEYSQPVSSQHTHTYVHAYIYTHYIHTYIHTYRHRRKVDRSI